MKKIKSLLVAPFIIILSSCTTTLDYNIPSNRFQTAEVSGRVLGGRVEIGAGRGSDYQLAQIYNASVINSTADLSKNQTISETKALSFSMSLGVLDRLDAYYYTYYDSADIFGLKFQFLGDVTPDKEGHKLAIMAGAGTMGDDESTSIKLDEPEKKYEGRIDLEAYEFALLYTYRFTRNFATYLNLTHSIYKVTAFLKNDSETDLNIRGYTRTNIVLLGVDLSTGPSKDVGVMIETGYSRGAWQKKFYNEDIPLGLNFYYKW